MTSDPAQRFLADRAGRLGRRTRLRPMATGEMLDSALTVLRQTGVGMLRAWLLPSVFCVAAWAFIVQVTFPTLAATSAPDSVVIQIQESVVAVVFALLVALPLMTVGLTLGAAATIPLAASVLGGLAPARSRPVALLLAAFRTLVRSCGPLLLGVAVSLVGGGLSASSAALGLLPEILVVCGAGIALFGLAAIGLVAATEAILPPVVVLESLSLRAAADRARNLMRGTAHHSPGTQDAVAIYGFLFLTAVLLWAGVAIGVGAVGLRPLFESGAAGTPLQPVLLQAVDLAPAYFAVLCLGPLWTASVTVLYFERRVRLEGFDIDALARGL